MPTDGTEFDEVVDLLVVGAGAAGMATALFAAQRGLKVLVCEKSDMVGGTTSTSAGTIWVPGTSHSVRDGVPDTLGAARAYLGSVIPGEEAADLRKSFLSTGPEAIDALEAISKVRFVATKGHPDYLGNHPGAAYGGRALSPLPFDGRKLGGNFRRVRPPRPEFMILGGLMVTKADIPALVKPFRSVAALLHVGRLVLRYGRDRLTYPRGTQLVMGNALVARLFYSLIQARIPIAFETALVALSTENERVTGASLRSAGQTRRVRARHGVVLATGGIGWSSRLRGQLFPKAAQQRSLAPTSVEGDGIEAATKQGAGLNTSEISAGLWMPCSVMPGSDGTEIVFPHIVLDRAKPGLLAVDSGGRRFVNEANSYHDVVMAMLADPATRVPAHLVCDGNFLRDYGLGLVHPGGGNLRHLLAAGYVSHGRSAEDLARKIGIDETGLLRTIAEYNHFAATGTDEAFGRGSTDLNRINGDPDNRPNPCLRPVGPGPLYAVAIWPADLANSVGLRTDADGRVLTGEGTAIPGLYACGNDAGSIFGGTYPGPGTTLGPAIVFAYRIAGAVAARRTGGAIA